MRLVSRKNAFCMRPSLRMRPAGSIPQQGSDAAGWDCESRRAGLNGLCDPIKAADDPLSMAGANGGPKKASGPAGGLRQQPTEPVLTRQAQRQAIPTGLVTSRLARLQLEHIASTIHRLEFAQCDSFRFAASALKHSGRVAS